MSMLERAIALAAMAHAGQTDKGGAPYILHPLRLMMRMQTEEDRIAAVLHDVVEDSEWTIEGLRAEGFAESVLCAVEALTRRKGEPYEEFVARAAQNPLARRVKRADLEDNSDLGRLLAPTDEDRARAEKYRGAIELLDRGFDSPEIRR
jgi:(p)ppGpp synthase/HD superfamily hydrolase